MSAANVRTSSTPTTTSSLRPRTRRLISGLDEGDEVTFDPNTAPDIRISSPISSAIHPRSASPIPPTHLSRPSLEHLRDNNVRPGHGTGVRRLGPDTPTSIEKLWGTSWTAIQGIASDLLGSSAQNGPPLAKGKVPQARSSHMSNHRASTSVLPPAIWGPKIPAEKPTINDVGNGSREEVEAAYRARKKLDMLLNQDALLTDSLGRHKRRTSDEAVPVSKAIEDMGPDALVYLHHVQKRDTLAGLTLKYNCSAVALRKANRMWPNDTIQTRDVIFVPLDACGVKGRPSNGVEEVDLLGDENAPIPAGLAEQPSPEITSNGDVQMRHRSDSNYASAAGDSSVSASRSVAELEPAWHHDSWVILPGSTRPIEIVRLSREALGYFPPARRKSSTFSDLDSPKTSFDRPRSMIVEALNRRSSHSSNRKTASLYASNGRRSSNVSGAHSSSYLSGPGGVGTMDRDVRAPGPAQDSLNLFFAKHLPDVAPPPNQHSLYQPDLPLFSDDSTPFASGHSTPNLSSNKNLEHVGGAIEAWMRRVASKAKDAMDTQDRRQGKLARSSAGAKGLGGVGDLIEMTDEFEIGDDYEDNADHNPRPGCVPDTDVTANPPSNATVTTTSLFASSSRHRNAPAKSGKDE